MKKGRGSIVEYRNYDLSTTFPIMILTGEKWRISDIPSGTLHFHNCLEIGICESDSGVIEFGNEEIAFKAGDITVIGSDVLHTTYSTAGTASKWTYIFMKLDELLLPFYPLNTVISDMELSDFMWNCRLIFHEEQDEEMVTLVRYLVRLLIRKETGYEHMVRGLMIMLTTRLYSHHRSKSNVAERKLNGSRTEHLIIAPALDYIQKYYKQDFPIDTLADLCGLSSTHFRRLFNAIMGVSPLAYLNQFRVQRATVLLRTTELTILDISEEVGFHSISSFNRHFSRMIGKAPLQWRKEETRMTNYSILKYSGWLTPETGEETRTKYHNAGGNKETALH